ncbi:PVC-type heme-binding CxxCH protein [Blastopirellula marina]|nr:PVC-type heme-binding CxxCH protein [Blastopirellula marina]
MLHRFSLFMLLGAVGFATTAAAEPPRVLDDRMQLEMIAESPAIVTPIGVAFDAQGRLLVIESQTHHRKEDYVGPEKDRIRAFVDSNGDGKRDAWSTFYEGTTFTMSLAAATDGSIYVATRMEIFRLRDTNNDGVADEKTPIAHLETKGNYPHNGLAGLTFAPDGTLIFGMGENLGAPFALVAADGTQITGGGEGGCVYQCEADGSKLRKIATGVWNPFGMCYDPEDRLFCVDNDPDGRPPCRLLEIVPTGDYGYQFRYGRSGVHPLQAWDAELPGTLPMAAGTGEAPCAVLYDHGSLLVTSWGDHRIERYALEHSGATVRGRMSPVVVGDENFRPTGMVEGPDGAYYFADWVDRSYPVHGKGRLWKLSWKNGPPKEVRLTLSDAEQEARKLAGKFDFKPLDSKDLFLRQAAIAGLTKQPARLLGVDWDTLPTGQQRLGVLQALRWIGATPDEAHLDEALADEDEAVRIEAVRWIADEQLKPYEAELQKQLAAGKLSARAFPVYLAAIAWLQSGKVGGNSEWLSQKLLSDAATSSTASPETRAMAIQLLPPNHASLKTDKLTEWAHQDNPALQKAAIQTLALQHTPEANDQLAKLAEDRQLSPQLQADAISGLASDQEKYGPLLTKLASDDNPTIVTAAQRAARNGDKIDAANRPPLDNVDAWLSQLPQETSRAAGWRVFTSDRAMCSRCHTFDGRGAKVGPDLTHIGARTDRRRILQSILEPSKEIAPMFVAEMLLLDDGRVLSGFPLHQLVEDKRELFVDATGKTFEVDPDLIVERRAAEKSIMPEGLPGQLTLDEVADLLTLLSGDQ